MAAADSAAVCVVVAQGPGRPGARRRHGQRARVRRVVRISRGVRPCARIAANVERDGDGETGRRGDKIVRAACVSAGPARVRGSGAACAPSSASSPTSSSSAQRPTGAGSTRAAPGCVPRAIVAPAPRARASSSLRPLARGTSSAESPISPLPPLTLPLRARERPRVDVPAALAI